MDKNNIRFSQDGIKISLKDLEITGEIAEEYFNTIGDNNQIEVSEENALWIHKNQKYLNIIFYGKQIIGFIFVIPATKDLMKRFLSNKLTEKNMFEEIKNLKFSEKLEAIYICSAMIKKEFRRNKLTLTAAIKLIKNLTNNLSTKPDLFYEPYSKEGDLFAKNLALNLNLKIFSK